MTASPRPSAPLSRRALLGTGLAVGLAAGASKKKTQK
jgi:hypothetical protein